VSLPEEPQRLSKVVAAQVPCSRREAEQYIAEGWVRVDGARIEEPQFRVAAGQRVEVDTQAKLQPAQPATLLLHKPARVTSAQALLLLRAEARWVGDTSGVRRTKSHAVGLRELMALPTPASGLAVFSQDGRIVRKLTEDAKVMEQELTVEVAGTIADGGLARLARAAHVSWQSETRLRFAGKGLALDQVPLLCEQVGLRVTAIRRIRIGRVAMAGLPPGQWRYLAPGEKF
jgi:23S rRNA pseudouridine2604 synthase